MKKHTTFMEANTLASELIPAYRRLEERLIIECQCVLKAIRADAKCEEFFEYAQEQYFDSIRYTMQNCSNTDNYTSFLRNHIHKRVLDRFRQIKTGRETLAKASPREFLEEMDYGFMPPDIERIKREFEEEQATQEEMEF